MANTTYLNYHFEHLPPALWGARLLLPSVIVATAFLLKVPPTQSATPASLQIDFTESAPKDWFSVTNTSACQLDSFNVLFDLSNTYGRLIFDTTSSGAGVEVYQPFEVRGGEIQLTSGTEVLDGDNTLSITISNLAPDQTASFTIDVDDTKVQSELGQIRVSRAEISGALIKVSNIQTAGQTAIGKNYSGSIDNSGSLSLQIFHCK